MAGSSGSPRRSGQVPQHYEPESEAQARAREYEHWMQMQREQAYNQQAGHGQPAHGQPSGHGQQGGGVYPQQPSHETQPYDPRGHGGGHQAPQYQSYGNDAPQGHYPAPPARPESFQGGYGQGAPAQDPHAGQHFEPYPTNEAHGGPQHGGGYDPRQGGYDQAHYPAQADPRDHHSGYGGPPSLPGAEAYRGEAAGGYGHPQAPPRNDLGTYDFSNYQSGQLPPGYGHQEHGGHHDATYREDWQRGTGPAGGHEPRWEEPAQAGYWPPQAGQHPGQLGAGGPAGAHHYQDPQHFEADPHDHDGYDTEEVDERRGPSTLVIVGALIGAIVAGGGLAYAYKSLGGGSAKGRPPVVKAENQPARTRPTDPGGKVIPHSDKLVLNRSADGTPPPVPTSLKPPGDVSAPKKVPTTTIIVNADGTIAPRVENGDAPGGSGVPGLLIDGLGPPPQSAPASAAQAAAPRLAPPPPPPPAVRPSLPPANAPSRVAELPLPKVQPKSAVPPRSALGAGANVGNEEPRRPATRTSVGGNGYVSVLASKRNCQDARNAFAGLFQKYPDVLAGKTPDVKEVNLADKGTWCRLIVGPPGSRQAARNLCVALKGRGMTDCWPVAY